MTVPELSRPISLQQAERGPERLTLAATEAERAALALRFDLIGLDRLEAQVTLGRPDARGFIEMQGHFQADVVQACVVTLEPVPAHVEGDIHEFFAEAGDEHDEEGGLIVSPDPDSAPEPIENGIIDVGEAVAQHLAMALDPYPRLPDGDLAALGVDLTPEPAASPFAALAGLKRDEPPR